MKILITESQLKYLITEGGQKIKVTDHCGVSKEYDYQTWYYDISEYNPRGSNWDGVQSNPRKDIYTYTINGSMSPYTAKFNGDWSYLISDIKSLSAESLKYKKCRACKKPEECIIQARTDASSKFWEKFKAWISESANFLQDFVDYVSIVADFIVPGSGIIIDVINTLVYLLRALSTSDTTKRNDLYLMTIVSAAFIFIPGPVQSVAPAIKTFIRSRVMTDPVLKALKTILSFIDEVISDLTGYAVEALKSPLAQTIATSFSVNASNIVEKIKTFGESLKNIINNLLTTAK